MAEIASAFFERKRGASGDGFDYETLREEAIALVQAYSGDVWTDFNIHDPGVTLIEAFCYALTDLVYRTEFPVADYLVSKDGRIDYEKLALYRPDQIFPSAAVTPNDYRKLLFDLVPHLENVWVEPADPASGRPPGIYDVFLQLATRVKRQDAGAIAGVYVTAVEKAFAANRNLCEKLGQVHILKKRPYGVGGRIELKPGADAATALAQVYARCDAYLNPKIQVLPYAEVARAGQPLEHVFTGPLISRGYIPDELLQARPMRFSIPELIKLVNELPEVKNVVELYFIDSSGDRLGLIDLEPVADKEPDAGPVSVGLLLPWISEVEPLQLTRAGKPVPVTGHDMESEFSRIAYRETANREKRTHFDWVDSALPTGTARDLADYFSFQQHLPDVYGLNAYGVPHSATAERKAQSLQLKAYLLFFDQVMANFLAQVQHIPELFSSRSATEPTHFHQLLGSEAVPEVASVYAATPAEQDRSLAEIRRRVDDPLARHDRIFDYLLALYGETLNLKPLQELAREVPEIERATVAVKREYLQRIVDLSARRGQGATLATTAEHCFVPSSLQRKIELVLGIEPAHGVQESANSRRIADSRVFLIEHIELYDRPAADAPESPVSADFYASQLTIVFSSEIRLASSSEFRQLAIETVTEQCPAHIYPHIVWADAMEFSGVAGLYERWLAARKPAKNAEKNAAVAAGALARKLISLHHRSE